MKVLVDAGLLFHLLWYFSILKCRCRALCRNIGAPLPRLFLTYYGTAQTALFVKVRSLSHKSISPLKTFIYWTFEIVIKSYKTISVFKNLTTQEDKIFIETNYWIEKKKRKQWSMQCREARIPIETHSYQEWELAAGCLIPLVSSLSKIRDCT